MNPVKLAASAVFAAGLVVGGTAATAQTFPTKPITMVLFVGTGGAGSVLARLLEPHLAKDLGQPIVIEHKPGAGGALAWAATARAAPDGHTIAMTAQTMTTLKLTSPEIDGNPLTDLAPITLLASYESMLVVAGDSPIRTLKDLAAESKKQPLFYSNFPPDARPLIIAKHIGANFTPVDYKSGGEMIGAVMGKQVTFSFLGAQTPLPNVKEGKLRGIFISGNKRHKALPDVPSQAEVLPGVDLPKSWFGFHAPLKTPPAIIERLNKALVAAAKAPDVVARMDQLGYDVAAGSVADFEAFLKKEATVSQAAVREFGLARK